MQGSLKLAIQHYGVTTLHNMHNMHIMVPFAIQTELFGVGKVSLIAAFDVTLCTI